MIQELLEHLVNDIREIKEAMVRKEDIVDMVRQKDIADVVRQRDITDVARQQDLVELRQIYPALLEGQAVLSARDHALQQGMCEIKATLSKHTDILEDLSVKIVEHSAEVRKLSRHHR